MYTQATAAAAAAQRKNRYFNVYGKQERLNVPKATHIHLLCDQIQCKSIEV